MKMIPDFQHIGRIVDAWNNHVILDSEAERTIAHLMRSENYIPACEAVRVAPTDDKLNRVLTRMQRFEIKLNSIIRHGEVPLPDDVNPDVLLDDVKALIDANNVIAAIKIHRDRTGMGFAEAKKLTDQYRNSKNEPHNQP